MAHRPMTMWAVQCDDDNEKCARIAMPPPPAHINTPERQGRYTLLSDTRAALAVAKEQGWVSTPGPDFRWYCPDHAHQPPVIREKNRRPSAS